MSTKLVKNHRQLVDTMRDGKFRNFITADVAAARYGRAPKALANDRKEGAGLPFYKHGRTVLYDQDECDKIILSNKNGGDWYDPDCAEIGQKIRKIMPGISLSEDDIDSAIRAIQGTGDYEYAQSLVLTVIRELGNFESVEIKP
jgi:hypothetical protein